MAPEETKSHRDIKMLSPCGGCDLFKLTTFVSWYCLVWDIIVISLNCYGLYIQARKRRILLEEQAASFVPQAGNTVDLAELEAIREKLEQPRSRAWAMAGLALSCIDLIISILFIQGVSQGDSEKIFIWCVGHTAISYSGVILTILAIKCNIRVDSKETPLGFSLWNSLYLIVDLYWLWIGVSFYKRVELDMVEPLLKV